MNNKTLPFEWDILMRRLPFTDAIIKMAEDDCTEQLDPMSYNIVKNMYLLSCNPNTPIEFIKRHWETLERWELSIVIPFDVVMANKELSWCCRHLCLNSTFPMSYFKETINNPECVKNIDFVYLSSSGSLTVEFFKEFLNNEWNFQALSYNNVVTVDFIEVVPDEDWNWQWLSDKTDINRMFRRFPNKPWSMDIVSKNPNLDPQLVLDFSDLDWDMHAVSRHSKVTLEFVETHMDFGWDFIALLCNSNIPFEIFLKKFELLPNDILVHKSMVGTEWCDYLLYGDDDFAYNELYAHSSELSGRYVTMDELLDHPEINWDYSDLSLNPNLSWVYVRDHPDLGWDVHNMLFNDFGFNVVSVSN